MTETAFYDQYEYSIRCEWGQPGVTILAPISDVVVIVDVLSFSTAVDIAVGNGAIVYPYRWRDDTAAAYAQSVGAVLAGSNRAAITKYSLAPTSLLAIPEGTRLVLPSPNGSTLTTLTGEVTTFAGCLRNARAVARAAQQMGERIAVIPAGERWSDESLRPAIEDLIGAGAIIHHLPGTRSPEAALAEAAFLHFQDDLKSCLLGCSSGKELVERGFRGDVELAYELDESNCAPILAQGAYVAYRQNTL
jgi:2-phosphosulfolactate phosphatase